VAPGTDSTGIRRRWELTPREWFLTAVIGVGIATVSASYFLLNGPPPPARWPSFYAWDPTTARPVLHARGGEPSFQAFILSSWLDAKIVFLPALAVPYLSFLVLVPIAIPMLLLRLGNARQFFSYGVALIVSQIVLDLAYLLFPTTVLRESPDTQSSLLVTLIRSGDQPFNAFPSGHATWTTIAIVALWRVRRRIPKTVFPLIAWLLLVYPATVSLHQHYIIDVYAGVFIGYACYWGSVFRVEKPPV
jgi:membrane-associated phospholipid phosphatase